MVLESTMICVDNSEWMRNGDFVPNRLIAQQDAVNLIAQCKIRQHPENNVGLLSMADQVEVLANLTQDSNRLFAHLQRLTPNGKSNVLAAIRIAHLALKHRQGRNHRPRIVLFIGSPLKEDKKDLILLAKRLKKEKVNVDVVNFGEETENTEKLTAFIEALNGKDGTGSQLVTVGSSLGSAGLTEALVSSSLLRGEDGAAPVIPGVGGAEFGIDPNEDPELALALRVSMEEQRARQEQESRQLVVPAATGENDIQATNVAGIDTTQFNAPNLDAMTEDEQIALALRMSLQHEQQSVEQSASAESANEASVSMETDDSERNEFAELLTNPAELENLVRDLPGVNPNSKEIQQQLQNMAKGGENKDKDKKNEK